MSSLNFDTQDMLVLQQNKDSRRKDRQRDNDLLKDVAILTDLTLSFLSSFLNISYRNLLSIVYSKMSKLSSPHLESTTATYH